MDRRLTDVKSYPFSFLVQSYLPQPQRTGVLGTSRVNSPAVGGSAGSGTNPRSSEDEGVNMKEVDGLLAEIAVMLGRWSLLELLNRHTDLRLASTLTIQVLQRVLLESLASRVFARPCTLIV